MSASCWVDPQLGAWKRRTVVRREQSQPLLLDHSPADRQRNIVRRQQSRPLLLDHSPADRQRNLVRRQQSQPLLLDHSPADWQGMWSVASNPNRSCWTTVRQTGSGIWSASGPRGGMLGAVTLKALRRAGFFAYLAEKKLSPRCKARSEREGAPGDAAQILRATRRTFYLLLSFQKAGIISTDRSTGKVEPRGMTCRI